MSADSPGPLLHIAAMPVRWRDLDAFNHVNNSSYLTYLEEARLHWLAEVPGPWHGERCAPILAASMINYRHPIEWPASLRIALHRQRLGARSLTIAHRIIDAGSERLYSDGHVVIVWIDPTSGTTLEVPQVIRDAVAATPAAG